MREGAARVHEIKGAFLRVLRRKWEASSTKATGAWCTC